MTNRKFLGAKLDSWDHGMSPRFKKHEAGDLQLDFRWQRKQWDIYQRILHEEATHIGSHPPAAQHAAPGASAYAHWSFTDRSTKH